jgi:hypothetical protein
MAGEPLRRELDELVRDWDRVAVPRHGRYVREPAIADERGVVRVPPPVPDPQLLVLAGVGLAITVGALVLRGGSRPARGS